MNKYEITDIAHPDMPRLHRIRALRDIPGCGVKAGDLGGYVESEANLSQSGDCWVYGSAQVYGSARVSGSARVYGSAQVYGSAWVSGSARVSDSARVSLPVHVQSGTGLPSGDWTLFRTKDGHTLLVGCWSGTTDELRALIARDDDWPEARGGQVTQRRPMLAALADMCDAVIATWEVAA